MKEMSWKEYRLLHIQVLKNKYEKWAKKWEDMGVKDDRILVVNIYRQILRALESLPKVKAPDLYVRVALIHEIDKDEKLMDSIIERFKDR